MRTVFMGSVGFGRDWIIDQKSALGDVAALSTTNLESDDAAIFLS